MSSAAAFRASEGVRASRRPLARLLGIAPAAFLSIGLAVISAGPLARPVAAADPPQTAMHAFGGKPTPGLTQGVSAAALQFAQTTVLPASVDLSAWDPPVGDQKKVGSCTSWATGYYYRYWLRNRALGETSTFAPMYLYSQIAHGVDSGSSFADNFNIMESQGIAPQAAYPQGDYDYTTQPTPAEMTAAAPYKIKSYANLFYGANMGNKTAVEASLAAGKPVDLMIPVYPNFEAASAANPLVDVPSSGQVLGLHSVFAPRYDAVGVWIENSWGTDWGQAGWAELSWAFVNQYAFEGWNVTADTWSVTLGATATSVTPGTSVTLTAKANRDVAPTPYFLAILASDNSVVTYCKSGKTCTASVSSSTAASRTYRAVVGESNGASPLATSGKVAVAWARPATHLRVAVGINPWLAGTTHSVTVKALDAYGNIAVGYRGTIHFTTSDTNASVPVDYTFTATDAGVHIFPNALNPGLTLRTAGSKSVTATDTATSSITGSETVTVTPGAAKTLSVSGIYNPFPAGSTHSFTVKALDAYGNVATGYTGTIHFTSSDPAATLPADYAFTAADKGVHTFPNTLIPGLTLKTAGSQWLKATDKSHSSIKGSQTVTVQ